jgi:hypothetical protein
MGLEELYARSCSDALPRTEDNSREAMITS